MVSRMEEMTSKEFADAIKHDKIVILPIGSIEEHGPHLPLATDCYQPMDIAVRIATELDCIVAPMVYYGNCSSTRDFPGSVSVRPETLKAYIYDILDSLATQGIKRIVVISGHAGRTHMAVLRMAVQEVVEKHNIKIMIFSDYDYAYTLRDIWPEIPDWDGHSGTIETARIMALRPELVRKPLPKGFKAEFPPYLIVKDIKRYIPEGYWGDPSLATESMGHRINEYLATEILKDIKRCMC